MPKAVVLRRQRKRSQMPGFFQRQPTWLIGMEACAGAHYRARELVRPGHDVRLMQPGCVKGYVRHGKTDKADAEAICIAACDRAGLPAPARKALNLLADQRADT